MPGNAERQAYSAPREPLLRLFLRFLRFGALAWGGPVVQIAMLRHEFPDLRELWRNDLRFARQF